MKPLFYIVAVIAVIVVAVDAKAAGIKSDGEEQTEGPPEDSNEDTEAPEQPADPTTRRPDPERPPQEGDACNHELCRNTGYCQSYLRCDKDKGVLVREECGEGLVWNSKNDNGTDHIHGGNCNTWESLDAETERNYRSDKDCLRCFWEAKGECSSEYLYQAPNLRHRNVLTLQCNDNLIFNPDKETCQLCSDVKRADGSDCCSAGNGTSPAH